MVPRAAASVRQAAGTRVTRHASQPLYPPTFLGYACGRPPGSPRTTRGGLRVQRWRPPLPAVSGGLLGPRGLHHVRTVWSSARSHYRDLVCGWRYALELCARPRDTPCVPTGRQPAVTTRRTRPRRPSGAAPCNRDLQEPVPADSELRRYRDFNLVGVGTGIFSSRVVSNPSGSHRSVVPPVVTARNFAPVLERHRRLIVRVTARGIFWVPSVHTALRRKRWSSRST